MPPRARKPTPEELAAAEQAAKDLELADQCDALEKARQIEEAQFNELQLQRDKLNHFWIIAKKQLEDKKADLRNKEREIQDLEERQAREITILKQRVKHLLFEHQSESTESKTDGVVAVKGAQDAHRESEEELKRDRRALATQLREMDAAHEAFVRELRREQDRQLTELRLDFERESRELQMQYDHRLEVTRRDLFEAREADVRRVERRKTKHIEQLLAAHERAFQDIKRFYSNITHSNLDMIKSLKEEVNELGRREQADEKRIVAIAQENKRLSGPLASALEEARKLRHDKEVYETELVALRDTKATIMEEEAQLGTLRWEHEILAQRFSRLEHERDDLREKFTATIYEVQQKAGFRNLLLERKLEAASEEVEKRSAQLAEILTQAHLDPAAVGAVESRVSDLVEAKEATVRELQAELERVVAAHNHAVHAFTDRLMERGVRPDEFGFVPMTAADILSTSDIAGAVADVSSAASASSARQRASAAAASGAGDDYDDPDGEAGASAAAATSAATSWSLPRAGVARRPPVRAAIPSVVLAPSAAAGGPRAAIAAAALSSGVAAAAARRG